MEKKGKLDNANALMREFAIKLLNKPKRYVLNNWAQYVLLRNLFFVTAIPIFAGLGYIFGVIAYAYFVFALVIALISLVLDGQRLKILEDNPEAFIEGERRERIFNTLTNIISYVAVALLYSLIPITLYLREQNKNFSLGTSFFQVLIVSMFLVISFVIPPTMYVFESTYLYNLRRNRPTWHIPEYAPSQRLRAQARFIVVSKIPTIEPSKQSLKKFQLIKDGIEIYDNLMKRKLGLVLTDPDHFVLKAKLKFFFTAEKEATSVKDSLKGLIDLMNKETVAPFEFVKLLREMVNEPISEDKICEDISEQNRSLKRWLTRKYGLLELIITPVVSSVIAGIILYILFH